MLVIPATWNAELRKISGFQPSLGKKISEPHFNRTLPGIPGDPGPLLSY
jgi:hypothetical protein